MGAAGRLPTYPAMLHMIDSPRAYFSKKKTESQPNVMLKSGAAYDKIKTKRRGK
jgi:hypothetical protein